MTERDGKKDGGGKEGKKPPPIFPSVSEVLDKFYGVYSTLYWKIVATNFNEPVSEIVTLESKPSFLQKAGTPLRVLMHI